jgi:hypothetical protein
MRASTESKWTLVGLGVHKVWNLRCPVLLLRWKVGVGECLRTSTWTLPLRAHMPCNNLKEALRAVQQNQCLHLVEVAASTGGAE